MSRKPARRKLRAAPSSTPRTPSGVTEIVPAKRMWPVVPVDVAFGHVGDTGATSALPSWLGDPPGQDPGADVVLAERHVRPALLGAADRHDDRRPAGGDRVAHLGPGHLLEEDRRLGGAGRRRQQQRQDEGDDGNDRVHGIPRQMP